MTRELGKSILLFVLVILSFTLTWSIWTYQGDYAPTNTSAPVKKNTIASAYNPKQVIKPYQMIRFSAVNSKEIKGLFGNNVDSLYNVITGSQLTPQATIPDHFPKSVGHSYELVYPTPISSTIIKNLFNFTPSNMSIISQDWLISKIDVFQTQSKTEEAYVVFKDQSGQPLFYAKGDLSGLKAFNKNYGDTQAWLNYTKLKLKSHSIYLPNEPIKGVPIESHLYSLVNFDLYKPILFSNPRQVLYSGNSYSDGFSQLNEKQKLVMQYYNIVTNSGTTTYSDPILESYNWINTHKGWTNLFNIDNFTSYPAKGQSEVTYRLTENGLPVYSTDSYPYEYESEIYLMYNSGELSKLNRTLIDVGISYKQPTQTVISTAMDTIHLLEKTGAFKLANISDFRLGYETSLNLQEQSITFTPSWFFKENGQWISVNDFLNNHSTTIHGNKGGQQ